MKTPPISLLVTSEDMVFSRLLLGDAVSSAEVSRAAQYIRQYVQDHIEQDWMQTLCRTQGLSRDVVEKVFSILGSDRDETERIVRTASQTGQDPIYWAKLRASWKDSLQMPLPMVTLPGVVNSENSVK